MNYFILITGSLSAALLYGPSLVEYWRKKDDTGFSFGIGCAAMHMIIVGGFAAMASMT